MYLPATLCPPLGAHRLATRLLGATLLAACQGCLLYESTDVEPRTTPPLLLDRPDHGSGSHSVPGPGELCRQTPVEELELELPVWDLFVTSRDWDALHEDVNAEVQVDAVICVEGHEYPIGLELQGASTRDARKKSFDLKFDRGQPLTGVPFRDVSSGESDAGEPYRRIIMKAMFEDESLIREALAFDLWREMGHEAPRIGYANLRINGDYWGLYVLVEPVNDAYLHRHGYPPDGQLYKAVRKHGERADFAPGRDLELAFENKTDEDDPSRDDLAALIEKLQKTPLERDAFESEIDPIFPLAEYFERMIWVAFTQNGDAVAQNYYLYNAAEDGRDRWHQLPWDSNLCFSAHWRDSDRVLSPESSNLVDGRNYFGRRLVRVGGLREAYVEHFFEVMDHVLPREVVLDHFERHADHVARDLALDQKRWRRNVDPSAAFAVLTDFIERRPQVLADALGELIAAAEPAPPAEPDEVGDDDDLPQP